MAKYKARHKCRKHNWVCINSGYTVKGGFWYHYACMNCDNYKTSHDPLIGH